MKISKLKFLISIVSIFGLSSFLFIISVAGNTRVKDLISLSTNQKKFIKKYFLPYKLISDQEKRINDQTKKLESLAIYLQEIEYLKKLSLTDVEIEKSSVELSNEKKLEKYTITSGIVAGINNDNGMGSAYLDFYEDNIVLLSSRGLLAFIEELDESEKSFIQIRNNLENFIGLSQFKKSRGFSIKDLLISDNNIYVSYTEEIQEDCWNTSVLKADFNYTNIKFKKLFSSKECIHSLNNVDNEFEPLQSGGRIISFDNDNILLSVGDYRSRYLAQDKNSISGKILKINKDTGNFEIIIMGIRNAQGLYFDKEKNYILETEHGPKGGDEINLVEIERIKEGSIPNLGWAISSAGEHYPDVDNPKRRKERYKKYPLHKSHRKYGFIEPLKSFVPSIGISEIVKVGNNKYVLGSLRDKSLYFFNLNDQKEIINLERVEISEQIRDLGFKKNKLFLFLQNTNSIGVINF